MTKNLLGHVYPSVLLLSLAAISDPGRRHVLSHRVYNRSEEQ